MNCSTCRFADIEILDDETITLTCHRYPPQLVAEQDHYDITQMWPQMLSSDWCGEYVSKEEQT